MTTPYFQVALNRDLEQDTARRSNAMKVLNVMLSEEAQNRIVADGQDVLSYSQNVPLRLTEYLKDVRSVVEENHMYIRIASNDFFAISKDVVSKMIAGEYTAQQAYRAFNAQLLAEETPADDEIVLTSGKSYSNVFHANGGRGSGGKHAAAAPRRRQRGRSRGRYKNRPYAHHRAEIRWQTSQAR